MSIDNTSKEVTVALAEIKANELGTLSESKNLFIKANHALDGLIVHFG
jgi:hypothetical protein